MLHGAPANATSDTTFFHSNFILKSESCNSVRSLLLVGTHLLFRLFIVTWTVLLRGVVKKPSY